MKEPQFMATYAGLGVFSLVMAHVVNQFGAWSIVLFFAPLILARQMLDRTRQLEEHVEPERDSG